MIKRTPVTVLGLGNILWGDDGLGVAAVTALAHDYDAPEGVRVLDGGTLGLSLLPVVQEAERLLLIDAIRAEKPAGSVVRMEGEQVAPAVRERLSPHQVGVHDLLEAARAANCYPQRLVLLGLVPQKLELGIRLSTPVQEGLPELIKRIIEEALSWGYAFRPRTSDHEPGSCDADNAGGTLRLWR